MSNYMQPIANPQKFKKLVRESRLMLTKIKRKTPFDVLVCRGLSGSTVAYTLSYLTGVPVIYLRKPGTTTHGTPTEVDYNIVFSANHPVRYLIVDDLISSGDTMRGIYDDINHHIGSNKVECIGIFLHSTDSFVGLNVGTFTFHEFTSEAKSVPIHGLKSMY